MNHFSAESRTDLRGLLVCGLTRQTACILKTGAFHFRAVPVIRLLSTFSPSASGASLGDKLRMAASAEQGTAPKPVTGNSGRTMTNSGYRGDSRKDGTPFHAGQSKEALDPVLSQHDTTLTGAISL